MLKKTKEQIQHDIEIRALRLEIKLRGELVELARANIKSLTLVADDMEEVFRRLALLEGKKRK